MHLHLCHCELLGFRSQEAISDTNSMARNYYYQLDGHHRTIVHSVLMLVHFYVHLYLPDHFHVSIILYILRSHTDWEHSQNHPPIFVAKMKIMHRLLLLAHGIMR